MGPESTLGIKGVLFNICRREIRRLGLILLVLWALPVALQAQFFYSTNNGVVTVTGYGGPGGVVTIPATVGGLPIVSIASQAFEEKTSITNLVVGTNITSIGDYAFDFCFNLTNVTLPNSLTTIGEGTFAECGLISATIPDSVSSLGIAAFSTCPYLKSVTISTNLTSLPQNTFYNCPDLTSATIPESVTSIGEDAFSGTGLTSVSVPTNVISLGVAAFEGCSSLTNVTLPASVTSIGENAFSVCPALKAINVDPANPDFSSVAGVLFNQNQTILIQAPEDLTGSYTVPGSVTTIGSYAFAFCPKLTGITLGTNITTIDGYAFDYSALSSITLPDSLTNIQAEAFDECTNLSRVSIPDSVTSIGEEAFTFCLFKSVTIPASVTSLGDSAFEACFNLQSIYCLGNEPAAGITVFDNVSPTAVVYYLAGTTGWGPVYSFLPTELLNPISGIGLNNNQFGFTISGTNSQVIAVQASTNLTNPNWQPLETNTLNGSSLHFTDPQWGNYPRRFYRVVLLP